MIGGCTNEPPQVPWNAPPARLVSGPGFLSHRFTYNDVGDVSADGRFVVVVSSIKDGRGRLFLRDMTKDRVMRVDRGLGGAQPDWGGRRYAGYVPDISAGGRYVVYGSPSTNLVRGDRNGTSDIFLYDRLRRSTRLISESASGAQSDGPSLYPSISADGRFVAFVSRATNLVAGRRTSGSNVFVRDLAQASTKPVSVASGGGAPSGRSFGPSISADGSRVAFLSTASDLVVNDDNRAMDAFVRDVEAQRTTRVSVTSEGGELEPFVYEESASSYRDGATNVVISGDGQVVAFTSHANGLVADDDNNNVDVFTNDLATGETSRVSEPNGGGDGYRAKDRSCGTNGECFTFISSDAPSLSNDGRFVAFSSGAPLLVPDDNPNGTDRAVFVHDRLTGATVLVNRSADGAPSPDVNLIPGSITGDGRWVTFTTDRRLDRGNDHDGSGPDVYLQRLPSFPAP